MNYDFQVVFEVESTVLGHHFPRFRSIIINQLKNLLRKKHTLPYFKLRGPPLIKHSKVLSSRDDLAVPPGHLMVTLVKCSRLQVVL